MIEVSIIVPVYNVEAWIEECLRSVAAQTISESIECIIVDDCGTDNSMDLAEKFMADYSGAIDFRILRHESNKGLSAARNSGIRAARGRYLYFLDSDDALPPHSIEALLEIASEYPSAQIVTGNFQTIPYSPWQESMSLRGKNLPLFSVDRNWIHSVFLSNFLVMAWNKLISRKFLIENGLFFREGILHEDNHWQAMAYHCVSAVAYTERVTYYYRVRQGSITQNPESNKNRYKALLTIYQEMAGMRVKWDRPWALWFLDALNFARFAHSSGVESAEIKSNYENLTNTLLSNPTLPAIMRLCVWYHRLPRLLMKGRIITCVLKLVR